MVMVRGATLMGNSQLPWPLAILAIAALSVLCWASLAVVLWYWFFR